MTNCPQCGAKLADSTAECPRCGVIFKGTGVSAPYPRATAAGAPPVRGPVYPARPVGTGKYLLWWIIALFSNAELVCFTLSIVFAFTSADRNRANFFRAVLLFKMAVLLLGMLAVVVLVLSGFSFTDLLNRIDFGLIRELLNEVI